MAPGRPILKESRAVFYGWMPGHPTSHSHCLLATRQVRSAGSGGATQRAEVKWTLLRMGHHVGLCLWRPWIVVVVGALKDSPNWSVGHSTKVQVSHVETSGVLIGASGNPQTLVLETRPLKRDTWKPKDGFRLVPRGLSSSIFCVWGHPSACLSGGSCSAFVRSPLFVQGELHDLGWPRGPWRFLLICGVVASGMGRVSLERAGTVL